MSNKPSLAFITLDKLVSLVNIPELTNEEIDEVEGQKHK